MRACGTPWSLITAKPKRSKDAPRVWEKRAKSRSKPAKDTGSMRGGRVWAWLMPAFLHRLPVCLQTLAVGVRGLALGPPRRLFLLGDPRHLGLDQAVEGLAGGPGAA